MAKVTRFKPADELPFKVELWFDDGGVERTLAAFARITDAKRFVLAVSQEYRGRTIRLRQGLRVLWERRG